MVTSGDGGQVPIGIPVGVVRVDDDGRPFVDLQEDLHNLSYVRIISTRDIEQPPRETNARTFAGRRPMSGQSPTGVQTPGQRVLVNVLPLFLIFFLILTGHVSSGFEFTAHFDPALFLVPVFFSGALRAAHNDPRNHYGFGAFQGYC
ncbi:MAG: hypothetical protein CM15mP21_0370 [Hyphomicrobiales bacterium]|nr:MAG: hypothetical protein CM15mP21_0370 [Hyphomicrobiales bacterium]